MKALKSLKHDDIIFSRLVGRQGSTVITKKVTKIITQYNNSRKKKASGLRILCKNSCWYLCNWQRHFIYLFYFYVFPHIKK